jgi:hypothetical protein
MQLEFKNIFSQSIVKAYDVELDHDAILKEIKGLKYVSISPTLPIFNSYISKSIKIHEEMKNGPELTRVISNYIKIACEEHFKFNTDFRIVNVWSIRTNPGGHTTIHTHKNYWLSFVYYPHGELKDNFNICFKNSNDTFAYDVKVKEYNAFNQSALTEPVKRGNLLIFSANMQHSIGYSKSKKRRYSIAGNIIPIGIIGNGRDGTLELR